MVFGKYFSWLQEATETAVEWFHLDLKEFYEEFGSSVGGQEDALNLDGALDEATFVEDGKRIDTVFGRLIGKKSTNHQIVAVVVGIQSGEKDWSSILYDFTVFCFVVDGIQTLQR